MPWTSFSFSFFLSERNLQPTYYWIYIYREIKTWRGSKKITMPWTFLPFSACIPSNEACHILLGMHSLWFLTETSSPRRPAGALSSGLIQDLIYLASYLIPIRVYRIRTAPTFTHAHLSARITPRGLMHMHNAWKASTVFYMKPCRKRPTNFICIFITCYYSFPLDRKIDSDLHAESIGVIYKKDRNKKFLFLREFSHVQIKLRK